MLYLNFNLDDCFNTLQNLTLTNVVFEFERADDFDSLGIFNFNKCCIWISQIYNLCVIMFHLTLTNVVFELSICHKAQREGHNLTLTNVVFEFM